MDPLSVPSPARSPALVKCSHLTRCPLRRCSGPIWSSARKRFSPPHRLFNGWDDIPGMTRLRHHLFSSVGSSGAGVKLCLRTTAFSRAWSDAACRSWEISKISLLFHSKHCREPSCAIFVKNQQYCADLCYPKMSICSHVVPAHSSREKEGKKPTATPQSLGKHTDCSTRGVAQDA